MPWAPRSSIAQEDASSASLQSKYIRDVAMYSADELAATSNTQALIDQLAASHAVQHQQECRIIELLSKEHDMSKELEQCRKREATVQAVFVKSHEREQKLATRECAIEEKEAQLKERDDEYNDKCKALDEKVKQPKYLQRVPGHHTPSASKLEADRIRQKAGVNYLGPSEYANWSSFGITAHFDTNNYPFFADLMNSQDVQTLRRHDYYMGYYQCAFQHSMTIMVRTDRLFEDTSIFIAENNGRNAGALFTFAALCANHRPEWDMRLDGKEWDLTIDRDCSSCIGAYGCQRRQS